MFQGWLTSAASATSEGLGWKISIHGNFEPSGCPLSPWGLGYDFLFKSLLGHCVSPFIVWFFIIKFSYEYEKSYFRWTYISGWLCTLLVQWLVQLLRQQKHLNDNLIENFQVNFQVNHTLNPSLRNFTNEKVGNRKI